ncbi:aquaporin-like protein [Hyaloraphidium curvatum]|nr:aquaporin-like protein [Hyaloraphidium curvatum]
MLYSGFLARRSAIGCSDGVHRHRAGPVNGPPPPHGLPTAPAPASGGRCGARPVLRMAKFELKLPALFGGGGAPPAGKRAARKGPRLPRDLPVAKYPPGLRGKMAKEAVQGLGELIGTVLFLFCGFGALESAATIEANAGMTNLTVAFGFGIGLLVNCWVFFRFTGGLFNPALTFAVFASNPRTFGWRRFIIYTAAQLAGGIAAAAMADACFPTNNVVTVNFPDNGTTAGQATVLELIGTYLLTSVVLMGAVEKSRATFLAPLAIGLTLFVVVLILNPFTTSAINPAKALGSAVVSGFWLNHWVYWVGPYSGALLAVLFHTALRMLDYQSMNGGVDDFDFTALRPAEPGPGEDEDELIAPEADEEADAEPKARQAGQPGKREAGGESAVGLLDDAAEA